MSETSVENKLKALERIVKSLTYAEKIVYHGGNPQWIEFHGVDPESFKLRGYSEGLDLDWSAEPYEREGYTIIGEGAKAWDAHMVAEIWLFEDPYERIKELEAQVQTSEQKEDLWRCPIITRMGMCPVTNIECPAHDPRCPHLPDKLRPEKGTPMAEPPEASDHAEVTVMDEGEQICCPRCGDEYFQLRKVKLSDRMLASARLDVVCIGCGYRESQYKIGDSVKSDQGGD